MLKPDKEGLVPDASADAGLAELLRDKVAALRAVRERLAAQGYVYWVGFSEVLQAVEQLTARETTPAELARLLIRKYGLFVTAYERLTKEKEDNALALEIEEIVAAIKRAKSAGTIGERSTKGM